MPKRTSDYRADLLEDLKDPLEAALYLNAALEDEDSDEMFLIALRDVAEARQMAQVAEGAGVSREALYRMLSKTGNPRYTSLTGILRALGLRLEISGPRSPKLSPIPTRTVYTRGSNASTCGPLEASVMDVIKSSWGSYPTEQIRISTTTAIPVSDAVSNSLAA